MSDNISRQAAIDIVRFECGEWWRGLAKTIENGLNDLPSTERTGGCDSCKRCSDYVCKTDEDKTRCPIEEHYALPKNGYCHLYEPRGEKHDV